MSRTVAIATLGCKTNQFESAAIEEQLKDAGYCIVPFEEGADLVVVNTCTVTARTDAQSRNLIRRARRLNLQCRVIVTGCYAQVDPEAIRRIPGVAMVIGNDEKRDLLRYLAEEQQRQLVAVEEPGRGRGAAPFSLSTFADRSRAFVQIQNGCDAFCSYCIIPYARGSSRSVPFDEVLARVDGLARQGYREVVLTGIHMGAYGLDLEPVRSLTELVVAIEEGIALPRLRLGSIEPTEISERLIERMAVSDHICPHLHIPLQSGADSVLRRMNRHYDAAFFHDLIVRIHRQVPEAAIGVDVIAGFPGESDEEFEQTRRLLDELPLAHLHVFPYSRRPGTPAADMPGQVAGDEIRRRCAVLRSLGERKARQYAERFVGRTLELVVEGGVADGWRRGLSRNYLNVRFRHDEDLQGQCVRVRVEGWEPAGLYGSLL
ncbi:threonylcarbamoyladenosine tRNA methylthiotransferase MtaB [Geothermobacter ehrlichii]|uniref:Threonylcarbamoyladenosine tRNA methylthiotransferase MtaB n=1 Tax=Geothermobacter ehrlichii TaxID=213224 RepID=A0A5D3WPI9_9BACT|nr:tRNA (N(6)-L-threonylcarbamoyladenosine(37)-C(2))-methylthiotransferase MtaB [Geothermobacter ehrlichii]TYO99601.1 threonylcarbamoyladenosine tRNA methylthiotransferase MtaB [Geothermobacter ehrlichii]